MTPCEQQLRDLLAPGTGCGPIGAIVRVAVRDGFLDVHAMVEHPIKHLPVPDAPRHAAAVDVGIRVVGPEPREFHVAFYAKLHQPRPALQFWGAPVVDLPLNQYVSSQRIVDDTHYEFDARVPLALLGSTAGQLGCRVALAGYRGGCHLVRFSTGGEGKRLPGWEGENGFALLDPEATFRVGALEQMTAPRAKIHLMSDAELGLDRLPAMREAPPLTDGSERLALDGDWRFSGTARDTDWRTWPVIRVPGHHALQNLVVEDAGRWVRAFAVPSSWAGLRALLRLDSVEGEARVRVNGREVAVLDSPYLPNQIDVTEALRPGEDNLLEITATQGGDLNAASARNTTSMVPDITGRVWLEALPAAWLENVVCDTDHAGKLELSWQAVAGGELACRLLDADRRVVWQARVPAASGRCGTRIAQPRLWHPEHPHLYTLELELDGRARYVRRIGFRSVAVAPRQLLVNGKPIKILGACHHPQQPLTGWWLREEEHRRDVALFRDANVNLLRVWPISEAFLDACDELGVMVQMEVPISFFNYSGNEFNPLDNSFRKRSPAVRDANVARTLRFLLRYRNRACVCLWSVGNESAWDWSFEASARLIKRLDPHRPVLVSGVGSSGMGVPGLDIDTEHYPLNRQRIFFPGVGDRPIFHTEWCHISCRNVGELAIDPGLHDRWVDAVRRVVAHTRDNDMGCIGGNIFTGMEAIAYAYPPGYPAAADHVPCLGLIDRWRRPTPEYHHAWKLFAPVELRRVGDRVFRVENRSFSAPLSAYRFTVARGGGATLEGDCLRVTGDLPLEISCWDAAGRLVNRWRYAEPAPAPERPTVAIRMVADESGVCVEHGGLRWRFRPDGLPVALRGDGEQVAWDIGRLVITPGALHPPSGLTTKWQGTALRHEGDTVVLAGKYAEAEGEYRYRFLADGRVAIGYRFLWRGAALRVRELGIAVRLPRGCDRLQWERDAEWDWYPADHIGRPVGATVPFPDPRALRAGPWELATWPWAHDATPAGCKDFRSTKRFIRRFALLAPGGAGLTFEADGDRHGRVWLADDQVVAQCCHFTGRSAEGFLGGVDLAEKTLEPNAAIESEAVCRFV
jgi:hypothetical protein